MTRASRQKEKARTQSAPARVRIVGKSRSDARCGDCAWNTTEFIAECLIPFCSWKLPAQSAAAAIFRYDSFATMSEESQSGSLCSLAVACLRILVATDSHLEYNIKILPDVSCCRQEPA